MAHQSVTKNIAIGHKTPHILGVGELIYDHVFLDSGESLRYIGSAGGGSVFNLLVNARMIGASTSALGVGGADVYGEAAKAELGSFGIDISGLQLKQNKRTQIIFQTITDIKDGSHTESLHTFSTECVICGSKVNHRSLARFKQSHRSVIGNHTGYDFVCFDKLTKDRARFATELHHSGVKSVLDIDRIGYLRYFAAAEIITLLNSFDIVFTSSQVVESLIRRLDLHSVDEVARLGPRLLLLVSREISGVDIYLRDNSNVQHKSVRSHPGTRVIDDAGAGDTFMAHMLVGIDSVYKTSSVLTAEEVNRIATEAVHSLGDLLASYGARGHLEQIRTFPSTIPAEWLYKTSGEITQQLKKDERCPFCWNTPEVLSVKPSTSTQKKIGAKGNVSWLKRRLFLAIEQQDAIHQCEKLLKSEGTGLVIGTGGSYPAAVFISQVLTKYGAMHTQPMKPFDYLRVAKKTNYVILVSYSGATKDFHDVIEQAVQLGVEDIILVTGTLNPKLNSSLSRAERGRVISYAKAGNGSTQSRGERGFISIAGTVLPCAVWTTALTGTAEMTRFAQDIMHIDQMTFGSCLDELRRELREIGTFHVLGGGLASPAVLDLESKFIESGIANIQVHESKDFSHGRFMSLFSRSRSEVPAVFLGIPPLTGYEKALVESCDDGRAFIPIITSHEGVLGSLELMILVQFFAEACGAAMETDMSKPKTIPQRGLFLYKWTRGLRD